VCNIKKKYLSLNKKKINSIAFLHFEKIYNFNKSSFIHSM
jgi:predicted MPP superfamily phosphohydrolase